MSCSIFCYTISSFCLSRFLSYKFSLLNTLNLAFRDAKSSLSVTDYTALYGIVGIIWPSASMGGPVFWPLTVEPLLFGTIWREMLWLPLEMSVLPLPRICTVPGDCWGYFLRPLKGVFPMPFWPDALALTTD